MSPPSGPSMPERAVEPTLHQLGPATAARSPGSSSRDWRPSSSRDWRPSSSRDWRPLKSWPSWLLSIVLAAGLSGCASGGTSHCQQEDCAAGESCVRNACRKQCAAQSDCANGQNCIDTFSDSGTAGRFCSVLDYAKDGRTGQFELCESDKQCDTLRGFTCLEGQCRLPCSSHLDCATLGTCQGEGTTHYCAEGQPALAGQFYSSCPFSSECDANAGFVCLGAGSGDLDAYCTTDCNTDKDCAAGFRCGTVGATPCEDACGQSGQQGASCIPKTEIGAGKRYQCLEPVGVVRRVCERRGFCSPCETDEDCLEVPGQICARDQSGEKICTQVCEPTVDSCPWGDASVCGKWDPERDLYTCAHRFGSCRGNGAGCEPCIDALDCSPNGFCRREGFTGEQFCIDLTVECDCGDDADANHTCTGHGCPKTPGGLPMICYAGSGAAGDLLSHRCIGATSVSSLLASPRSGCWKQ